MDIEDFSRLTGLFYDAAIDPARWHAALQAMVEAFQGSACSLITRHVETRLGRSITTHDPETEREFWNRWRDTTPLGPRREPHPLRVETDRHLMPRRELLGCAYYNEFLRPRDLHSVLVIWLDREGPVQPTLGVTRHPSAEEFGPADIELGHLLLPHVQRAVTFEQRLRHHGLAQAGAVRALDLLRFAVIVLDEDGRPLHANRAAERLLAAHDGLMLSQGRLRAATPGLSARLDAILAHAVGKASGGAASGGMALPRPGGGPALVLLALPVRLDIDWLRPHRPAVCICIADPAAAPQLSPAQLAAFFGLTPAEAAIVRELLDGGEIAQIADRLRLSPYTVRAHLARIMGKTDTRRQADLVRRLMAVPPVCG